MAPLAIHHRRSNVETTMWMIKSKFGGAVRAKLPTAQMNLAERCGPIGRSRHIEERQGVPVLAFGKHAGRPLQELAAGPDRGYLEWMLQGDFPADVKRECQAALQVPGY